MLNPETIERVRSLESDYTVHVDAHKNIGAALDAVGFNSLSQVEQDLFTTMQNNRNMRSTDKPMLQLLQAKNLAEMMLDPRMLLVLLRIIYNAGKCGEPFVISPTVAGFTEKVLS